MHKEIIEKIINESVHVHNLTHELIFDIEQAGRLMISALRAGKKILVCGNGGSAAEAQHFSSELIGKFEKERVALPAIALTTDGSNITAIGNDTGYEYVFSRQVEALGNEGDILVCLTTSDYSEENKHSMNLQNAFLVARKKNMRTILIGSIKSKKISEHVDVALKVNNEKTARIQEAHLLIVHILSNLIEEQLP
ncbi:MAG: phosphoheptose isomerase [archaeon]|jgi:D-sedoheptulose 7-phosphate isomerase